MKKVILQRERFIDATIHKVAELGLENLRTRLIASEVDMSEASMFLYFGNKEGILRETFLEVDRRFFNVFLKSFRLSNQIENMAPSAESFHWVWREIYRYLISKPDETLFAIRYRYSSYYTPEVRAQQQVYNSSLGQLYPMIDTQSGEMNHYFVDFFLNYVLELTLSFAEKIINGYLADTPETEEFLWKTIEQASMSLTAIRH